MFGITWGVIYKMRNFKKIIQKSLVIAAISAFLIQSSASAFNGAILKGIKIDLLNNNNYRITIKTDKDVPIKKYVTAANKIVLDLKDIKPAQFVNTVYNGAADMDHVIVQPSLGNNVRIFFQGLNIASSKIILDTRDEALDFLQTPINTENNFLNKQNSIQKINKSEKRQTPEPIFIDLSEKKISPNFVNNSIDKVKSITPIISYQQRSKNNFNIVKNSVMAGNSTNKIFNASIFDWALRFLMLGTIIAAVIKLFRKPKNIKINLTSEKMKSREMNMYKSAETQKERLTRSLGMPGFKENAAKKPNYPSISQYGLKEYKNSQLPPRKMNISMPERNMKRNRNLNSSLQKAKVKPANTATKNSVKPMISAKITKKQTQGAQKNFDGTKFLETMASIYQKSGRTDMATGIRQNIIKKQQLSA